MSGHSKWSKVKHQKATTDAVKGQSFTKASRAITMAVKEGGGVADPQFNFKLRLAIEKAKDVNMPKDNIARAIDKAKGAGESALEEIYYECYGPAGVAILIHALTDNRQRTVSAVKNILDRYGGILASPGAIARLFTKTGLVLVERGGKSDDELYSMALESGADDVVPVGDECEFYCTLASLHKVQNTLHGLGFKVLDADMVMRAKQSASVPDQKLETVHKLINDLENHDDIQNVYTNLE